MEVLHHSNHELPEEVLLCLHPRPGGVKVMHLLDIMIGVMTTGAWDGTCKSQWQYFEAVLDSKAGVDNDHSSGSASK
jgi:hypothetical protein